MVGQEPTVIIVGAAGVFWIFFLVYCSFLWETARYRLKIYCLKGLLNQKHW